MSCASAMGVCSSSFATMHSTSTSSHRRSRIGWSNRSCRYQWIDCEFVKGRTVHGSSLTARKPAVGVGATWQFAGTPPSLAASTHVRDSGEALNDHKSLHAELVVKVPLKGTLNEGVSRDRPIIPAGVCRRGRGGVL